MTAKITAWSYSRWNEYMQCPFKAKCKVIDKLKEPGSAAMDRGSLIHAKIEHYLSNGGHAPKEIPPALKVYYKALRAEKPKVELELCFNSKWQMVDWFAGDAWFRAKVDALVPPTQEGGTVRVVDHKTGKLKEYAEYEDQLELYGIAGLLTVPVAKAASAELAFVDHGKVVPAQQTIKIESLPALKKKWEDKTKAMMNDTVFSPKPGKYCMWCHFRKSNGGPCSY